MSPEVAPDLDELRSSVELAHRRVVSARSQLESARRKHENAQRTWLERRDAYWDQMQRLQREQYELLKAEVTDYTLHEPPLPAVEFPLERRP